jgi:hypothetical protein
MRSALVLFASQFEADWADFHLAATVKILV